MPIQGIFYIWDENAINVQPRLGVYAFYNTDHELIYIGQSENLRERFRGYRSSDFNQNSCLRSTIFYKREFTDNHEEKEQELLTEYENEHGNLPRCNTQHP